MERTIADIIRDIRRLEAEAKGSLKLQIKTGHIKPCIFGTDVQLYPDGDYLTLEETQDTIRMLARLFDVYPSSKEEEDA